MANFLSFDSRETMVAAITADTRARLEAALGKRGEARWAVSGGSTPAPLFAAMADADLGWHNVKVALVDERWVEADHARSNTAFLRRTLLTGKAADAAFTPMKVPGDDPFAAAPIVDAAYKALDPFDLVLLGMGPDGHIASLFPSAEGLEAAMQPDDVATVRAIRANRSDVTGDEVLRLTLTLGALTRAGAVQLMITGDDKKAVYDAATDPSSDLPIGRVARALGNRLSVYWAA